MGDTEIMATFWDRVKTLDGVILETSTQAKQFKITEVRFDRICFLPLGGKSAERWWPKRNLEDLNELFYESSEVTREMVRKHFPKDQNTSYIAAILNAIKEEDYSKKPESVVEEVNNADEPVLAVAEVS
jgi:hypothetical protein